MVDIKKLGLQLLSPLWQWIWVVFPKVKHNIHLTHASSDCMHRLPGEFFQCCLKYRLSLLMQSACIQAWRICNVSEFYYKFSSRQARQNNFKQTAARFHLYTAWEGASYRFWILATIDVPQVSLQWRWAHGQFDLGFDFPFLWQLRGVGPLWRRQRNWTTNRTWWWKNKYLEFDRGS